MMLAEVAVALALITPAPTHAPPAPLPNNPTATTAQAGLQTWQRTVRRRVMLAARRHSLRIAFKVSREGGELIDVHVTVLSFSARDIEVEGQVIWEDAAGSLWLEWKRCYASLDFGGGDFPQPRRIVCSPERDRNWHRTRLG